MFLPLNLADYHYYAYHSLPIYDLDVSSWQPYEEGNQ